MCPEAPASHSRSGCWHHAKPTSLGDNAAIFIRLGVALLGPSFTHEKIAKNRTQVRSHIFHPFHVARQGHGSLMRK
jgi:hypothetical protein